MLKNEIRLEREVECYIKEFRFYFEGNGGLSEGVNKGIIWICLCFRKIIVVVM